MTKTYVVKRVIVMIVDANSKEEAAQQFYSLLDSGDVYDFEGYGGDLELPDNLEEDHIVCLDNLACNKPCKNTN